MKIQTLKIYNFMPYKGRQDIEFPQHETQNVMLVFGDNMRGKTCFLNSLRWCFYGIALARNLREIPRASLVNIDARDEGDWKVSVSVLFEHGKHRYELTRSIDRRENSIRPSNNADFVESLGLRKDGTPIKGDAIKNEINQVMPLEISRFFLFDGELLQEYENLLIEESGQGEKIKSHIESILGVPSLIHAREELQTLLKKARTAQRKDAQKDEDLRAYAQQLQSLEVNLDVIEKNHEDLRNQRLVVDGEISEIDEVLKNTEAVQKRKMKLTELTTRKKNLEEEASGLNDSVNELLKTVWKDVLADSSLAVLKELKLSRESLQKEIERTLSIQNEITVIKKTISESLLCATCGQEIPESYRASLNGKLEELESQLGGSTPDFQQLTELINVIDKLEDIRSEGEVGRIIESLKRTTKINLNIVKVENEQEEIEQEIKGYDTDKIMRQREKKQRFVKQSERIGLQIESAEKQKADNLDKQGKISELIKKHKGTEDRASNKRVDVLQQLETVFKEGISQLRLKLKDDVQEMATAAFKLLSHEETYAGLQINDNYGLSILDPKGRVLDERSAGAEQVVALSLIDGLNRTSGTKAPIVMDTPLGRLDPKHRENILRFLPDMADQVVLLVHEGEIHPERDTDLIASRIGARYEIVRVTATHSKLTKVR